MQTKSDLGGEGQGEGLRVGQVPWGAGRGGGMMTYSGIRWRQRFYNSESSINH